MRYRKQNRIFSYFMAIVCMCAFVLFGNMLSSFEYVESWTSHTSAASLQTAGSTNSESNPYLIYNGAQFAWFFQNKTSNAYAKLMSNIELSKYNYNISKTYSGKMVLDGNNFAVSGLKNEAIFRIVQGSSTSAKANITVKNLIINASINHSGDAAAIIRKVNNYSNITMTNVAVHGSIKGTGSSDAVGALVAWSEFSTSTFNFTNCINYATISGETTGGLGGLITASSIKMDKCANFGTISGSSDSGGLMGKANGSSTLTKCFNIAAVTSSGVAGGIFGSTNNSSSYTNCYNTGAIKSTGKAICGGFIGQGNGKTVTLTSCYNTGTITTDYSYVTSTTDGGSGVFGKCKSDYSLPSFMSQNVFDLKPLSGNPNGNGVAATPLDGGGSDLPAYMNMEIKWTITNKVTDSKECTFSANSTITASKSKGLKRTTTGNGDILNLRFDFVCDGVAYCNSDGSPVFGTMSISSSGTLSTANPQALNRSQIPTLTGGLFYKTSYYPSDCDGYVATSISDLRIDLNQNAVNMGFNSLRSDSKAEMDKKGLLIEENSTGEAYYVGVCYSKSGNTITLYPRMSLALYVYPSRGTNGSGFIQKSVKYYIYGDDANSKASITIPSAGTSPNYVGTVSASTLGDAFQTISGMNGGYPIIKDFYWAYTT